MYQSLTTFVRLGVVIGVLGHPLIASAQPAVAPGGSLVISDATGGDTACRIGGVSTPCVARFNGTGFATPDTVAAHYDQLLPALGAPNYAAASLFADFDVSGPLGSVVDAQISTTFNFTGLLLGGGAYKTSASLTMHVIDVTGGANVQIASHPLFEQERSGDQGFTDVSSGGESQAVRGSNVAFQVKLRRGHTYRLSFEVEVLGEALVVGKVITDASASWGRSIVTVDEDEVDLLGVHDAEVKGALSAHDSAIKSLLATHDADIKRELDAINKKLDDNKALLDEIKRLLLTPQGRREGFPIK